MRIFEHSRCYRETGVLLMTISKENNLYFMQPLTIQEIKQLQEGTLVVTEIDYGYEKVLVRGIVRTGVNDTPYEYIGINNEISANGVDTYTALYLRDAIDETTIKPPGSHRFRIFLDKEESHSERGYSYASSNVG
jgi:hypothetical protein